MESFRNPKRKLAVIVCSEMCNCSEILGKSCTVFIGFSDLISGLVEYTWVCLKIGYIPNYSHLIGIMMSKTIGFRGTLFSDKPICQASSHDFCTHLQPRGTGSAGMQRCAEAFRPETGLETPQKATAAAHQNNSEQFRTMTESLAFSGLSLCLVTFVTFGTFGIGWLQMFSFSFLASEFMPSPLGSPQASHPRPRPFGNLCWLRLGSITVALTCGDMLQLIFAGTKRPTDPVHQAASAAVSQRDYQLLRKKRRNLRIFCSGLHNGNPASLRGWLLPSGRCCPFCCAYGRTFKIQTDVFDMRRRKLMYKVASLSS